MIKRICCAYPLQSFWWIAHFKYFYYQVSLGGDVKLSRGLMQDKSSEDKKKRENFAKVLSEYVVEHSIVESKQYPPEKDKNYVNVQYEANLAFIERLI
jgi:hypothetical protein